MTAKTILFKSEILIYFGVYIAYLIYGLHSIIAVRDQILSDSKYQFDTGWSLIRRPRDSSNDELESFTDFMEKWWPFYVLHLLVISATRIWLPQKQSSAHALTALMALAFNLKLMSIAVLILLLCSYYALSALRVSKSIIWLHSAFWMFIINCIKNSEYFYESLDYAEYYTLIIMLSWSLLRCCSFTLNRLADAANNVQGYEELYGLQHFFGYTLYWPMLIYGPFMGYRRYLVIQRHTSADKLKWYNRLFNLLLKLARVLFWYIIMQFALHFMYIHCMAKEADMIALVGPPFGQHAVGYFMGQFFFIYYVITYGLGIAFAQHDGLAPPHKPRCIGRIHFYSDMWKYFDEGLYEFLFRHIYAELCGRKSATHIKILATAVTFAFVFVWHGCYMYVLIWSILNFCCLIAEKFFKAFVNSIFYEKWITATLGVGISQRLKALLATQLFIPAAFSNVYFISGDRVGNYLMKGAYLNGWSNYLALSFCSYCFFQCSELILNWQRL